MNKIIETKVGTLDYEQYPLIYIRIKKRQGEPNVKDIDDFVAAFRRILNSHTGAFIFFTDAKEAKWVKAEYRDYFGVSMQALEAEYIERHKASYILVPNVLIYVFIKLASGFSKPQVPLIISFKEDRLRAKADKHIEELKS